MSSSAGGAVRRAQPDDAEAIGHLLHDFNKYMDLGTSENDTAARALYESLGFTNREGGPAGPLSFHYEREL